MELTTRNRQYPAIDVMKMIMAILVVHIHRNCVTWPVGYYLMSDNMIGGISVPFFFITSSFLFFDKIKQSREDFIVFRAYEKRLFILYTIWSLAFFPVRLIQAWYADPGSLSFRSILVQGLLLAKDYFWSKSFVHLWFVNTLMVSVAVLYFAKKRFNITKIMCAVLALMLVGYGISYSELPVLQTARAFIPEVLMNAVKRGVPCCALGLLTAETPKIRTHILPKLLPGLLLLFGTGALLYQAEDSILTMPREWGKYLLAWTVVILCLRSQKAPKPVHKTLRAYSSLIYFTHLLFISDYFTSLTSIFGLDIFMTNFVLRFLITLLWALFCSTVIFLLSRKWKIFKFFY